MRLALVALSVVAFASLTGCSDPAPVLPDGAFFLQTTQSDPTQCMIAGNFAQVGVIDANNKNAVVSDGQDKAVVDCNVSGTSNFDIYAVLDDTGGNSGDYFEMLIGSIGLSATEDNPAKGAVAFSAPWTAGNAFGGACNFWVESGNSPRIDNADGAGKVWVSFSCPGLTSGMSTCPLQTGFALFENCLTTPHAE